MNPRLDLAVNGAGTVDTNNRVMITGVGQDSEHSVEIVQAVIARDAHPCVIAGPDGVLGNDDDCTDDILAAGPAQPYEIVEFRQR